MTTTSTRPAPSWDLRYRRYCRVCHEKLPEPFFSLGNQPLANNLPHPGEEVMRAPLSLSRCPKCTLVQTTVVVNPQILFGEYLYTPSQSAIFHEHFAVMANHLTALLLKENDLVVDIGSNDGLLLSKYRGMRVVGVEPAAALAQQARDNGVFTKTGFWDMAMMEGIRQQFGKAKLITATNVFAHVDQLHTFLAAAAGLLAPGGALVIEVPRLGQMIEDGTFDLIYHEHLSYFSIEPVLELAQQHGLELFRVETTAIHGGSYRLFLGDRSWDWAEMENTNIENTLTDDDLAAFVNRAHQTREDFVRAVHSFGSVAGYGAPAKATVLMNFADLGRGDVKFIVDDNPLKQGRLLPGTEIPIVPSEWLWEHPVDAVIVFPWNIADDILPKLRGKVKHAIIPMPDVRVIDL